MIALIVKPSLLGKSKFERLFTVIDEFKPVLVKGKTVDTIKSELEKLKELDPNLTVVACGGDGTVHLALNSLPDLDIPLAVIPMGTGNDFARYLSIKHPKQAIDVLRNSTPISMDMGTIELSDGSEFRFAGIASCGFDAQVNERANTYRGPAGTIKYLAALAVEMVNLNSRQLSVSIDDGPAQTEEFTLIAVGNTSSYGGGLRMCPTANAYDQAFEVTFVEKITRRLLIRVLPKVFWGGHTKHRQVRQALVKKIVIGGEQFPIYADGEKIGYGPVVVSVRPNAMRVWQASTTNTP